MKKSAIALAVTAALGVSAAAQAETTLYGSARVSVDWSDPGKSGSTASVFSRNNVTPTNPYGFVGTFSLGPRNIDPIVSNLFPAVVNPLGLSNTQYWQVYNDASRLGVRGSEDLGSGLSAIYQYEFGVNISGGVNDFTGDSRPKWVGLKGDFGAITAGTQYTPYYNVIGYTDTFNDSKTFSSDYFLGSTAGPTTNAANMQQSQSIIYDRLPFQKGIAAVRKGYSVIYTTPNWYGLSAQGLIQMNGTNTITGETPVNGAYPSVKSPTSIDSWEANITYNNGPWFAGLAYVQAKDSVYQNAVTQLNTATGLLPNSGGTPLQRHSDNQYGAAVGYDNKQFSAAFSWQFYNPNSKNIPFIDTARIVNGQVVQTGLGGNLIIGHENVNSYTGQLSYTFGNEVVRASYSWINPQNIDAAASIVEAGFQHNLSKRTRVWVEYLYDQINYPNIYAVSDAGTLNKGTLTRISTKNANENTVSVGIRHDF